jgi:hypothetical protein
VVKQLTVEILQQCCSVSTCMQTHIAMLDYYTGCQHFKPFVWIACPAVFCFTIQNIAQLTGNILLWHRHTTYFAMQQYLNSSSDYIQQ